MRTVTPGLVVVVLVQTLFLAQLSEARRRSLTASNRFKVENAQPISGVIVNEGRGGSAEVQHLHLSAFPDVALPSASPSDQQHVVQPVMTCRQWIEAKTAQLGMTTKELAASELIPKFFFNF